MTAARSISPAAGPVPPGSPPQAEPLTPEPRGAPVPDRPPYATDQVIGAFGFWPERR